MQRKLLSKSKLIVIKIGSSTLTDKSGKLDLRNLSRLVAEISALIKKGRQVIIVSSGAIVTGSEKVGIFGKTGSIAQKQAVAAIGQIILMRDYEKLFSKYGLTVAQILLTRDAIENSVRRLNARNTLAALLKMGVVPIINENDTVAVDEIKVGDNDTLAALVASLIGADLLIMLTDVDGFYQTKIKSGKPKLVGLISKIDAKIEAAAGHSKTAFGTGGMFTKIKAAKIASAGGVPMVIAHGRKKNTLQNICGGKDIGTLFESLPKKA